MSTIRHDLSQYFPMKAIFESILGNTSFMKVKDCGSFKAWKKESINLLKAVAISINTTVEIADDEWRLEINSEIQDGIKSIKTTKEIDEMFCILAATLTTISFLQIGFLPRDHWKSKRVSLISQNWKLNSVRSVQYVQNNAQKEIQLRLKKIKDDSHEKSNSPLKRDETQTVPLTATIKYTVR